MIPSRRGHFTAPELHPFQPSPSPLQLGDKGPPPETIRQHIKQRSFLR